MSVTTVPASRRSARNRPHWIAAPEPTTVPAPVPSSLPQGEDAVPAHVQRRHGEHPRRSAARACGAVSLGCASSTSAAAAATLARRWRLRFHERRCRPRYRGSTTAAAGPGRRPLQREPRQDCRLPTGSGSGRGNVVHRSCGDNCAAADGGCDRPLDLTRRSRAEREPPAQVDDPRAVLGRPADTRCDHTLCRRAAVVGDPHGQDPASAAAGGDDLRDTGSMTAGVTRVGRAVDCIPTGEQSGHRAGRRPSRRSRPRSVGRPRAPHP